MRIIFDEAFPLFLALGWLLSFGSNIAIALTMNDLGMPTIMDLEFFYVFGIIMSIGTIIGILFSIRITHIEKHCKYCGLLTILRDSKNKPECIACYKGSQFDMKVKKD